MYILNKLDSCYKFFIIFVIFLQQIIVEDCVPVQSLVLLSTNSSIQLSCKAVIFVKQQNMLTPCLVSPFSECCCLLTWLSLQIQAVPSFFFNASYLSGKYIASVQASFSHPQSLLAQGHSEKSCNTCLTVLTIALWHCSCLNQKIQEMELTREDGAKLCKSFRDSWRQVAQNVYDQRNYRKSKLFGQGAKKQQAKR